MQHLRSQFNKYKFYNSILNDKAQNIEEEISNNIFLLYALKTGQMQPKQQLHYNLLSHITAGKHNTLYYDSYTGFKSMDGAEKDRIIDRKPIEHNTSKTSIYEIKDKISNVQTNAQSSGSKNVNTQKAADTYSGQMSIETFVQEELNKYQEDYDCVHIQKILKVDPRQYLRVKELLLQ